MTRLELTCDTCKRTTTELLEPDRIEYWGAGLQQQFSVHAVKVPVAWNYYFDVDLLCRLACSPACVRRKEPHPR